MAEVAVVLALDLLRVLVVAEVAVGDMVVVLGSVAAMVHYLVLVVVAEMLVVEVNIALLVLEDLAEMQVLHRAHPGARW